MSNVLLTAGYDRAWHSVLIAESLRRQGTPPTTILIAYPMSLARIRTIFRNRGGAAIVNYLLRRSGAPSSKPSLVQVEAQKLGVDNPSLKQWARHHGVKVVTTYDLNSQSVVRKITNLSPSITAYTGGGILRESFIDSAERCILNAHSGQLPMVRGMNALEWSVLLNKPTGVTMHLIDEGIDTGAVAEWIPVTPQKGDSLDGLRERLVLAGAQGMVRWVSLALNNQLYTVPAAGPRQRQCFVVAPALLEICERRLARRLTD
jgi:folate-dependent phosphoribosylglycinamide formyltransferase PurN